MKKVHRISSKQHRGIKSGVAQSIWRSCGCSGKSSTVCHQWTKLSSPSKQSSYSAIVSTGCGKHMFVLTAHYDVSITSRLAKNI